MIKNVSEIEYLLASRKSKQRSFSLSLFLTYFGRLRSLWRNMFIGLALTGGVLSKTQSLVFQRRENEIPDLIGLSELLLKAQIIIAYSYLVM